MADKYQIANGRTPVCPTRRITGQNNTEGSHAKLSFSMTDTMAEFLAHEAYRHNTSIAFQVRRFIGLGIEATQTREGSKAR